MADVTADWEQLPLIEGIAEGERLRAEGMAEADAHADQLWKDRAFEIGCTLARTEAAGWVANDILDRLDAEGYVTHENRALGPVVRRVLAEVPCRSLGSERSARASLHRALVRRWQGEHFAPTTCHACGQPTTNQPTNPGEQP